MSKQYLKEVFCKMKEYQSGSLQLLQIKNSMRNGTSYISREIEINPNTKVSDYIRTLSDYYCSDNGIESFSSVDAYTGDIVDHVVYKISRDDQLIKAECDSLISKISDPDRESSIANITPNALIIKGAINVGSGDADTSVVLAIMQKPLSILSNKFLWTTGEKFHELEGPVLTLRKTIDIAIVDSSVYLFTLAGENLFNMERTYKAVCRARVDEIAQCDFLTNIDSFKAAANQGRNPRRFISYNPAHFYALQDVGRRKRLADKFGLPLKGEQFVTDDSAAVEKLVKFLCNKAMLDPCDENPMEVSATKPWVK